TGPSEAPMSMPEYTRPYTVPVAPLGVTRRMSMSREGPAIPEHRPASATANSAVAGPSKPLANMAKQAAAPASDMKTMNSLRGVLEATNPTSAMPTAAASM